MGMTLWEARGRIREMKPSATPSQVDGWINRRVQNVLDVRVWSDTMKIGMVSFPDATHSGTVNMTPGSDLVAGNGTTWPINDAINTVIVNPIKGTPGYVQVTPGSGFIGSIKPGMTLLLDQENASVTEVITVQAVGPVSFTAYCYFAHDQNVTLQRSKLAGQQLATDTYTWTVVAVLSATSLKIDATFGGLAQSSISYMIRQQYFTISPTARFLKGGWDAIAGQPLGTLKDFMWLNKNDPQRTQTGNPLQLVMIPPAPGGVMQWECWPWQSIKYQIGVIYQDGWPTLRYDTDLLPPFINAEVVIAGGTADALRTKCIKKSGDRDDWYDPQMANSYWEPEFARLMEYAIQSDQGRRTNYLTNYLEEIPDSMYDWLGCMIGGPSQMAPKNPNLQWTTMTDPQWTGETDPQWLGQSD